MIVFFSVRLLLHIRNEHDDVYRDYVKSIVVVVTMAKSLLK